MLAKRIAQKRAIRKMPPRTHTHVWKKDWVAREFLAASRLQWKNPTYGPARKGTCKKNTGEPVLKGLGKTRIASVDSRCRGHHVHILHNVLKNVPRGTSNPREPLRVSHAERLGAKLLLDGGGASSGISLRPGTSGHTALSAEIEIGLSRV